MKSNEEQEALRKKLVITLAVAVAAVALAVATIITLKTVVPEAQSSNTQTPAALTAKEAVGAYSIGGVVKALSETTYSQQINSESESRVLYKADGHSYITSIPAKNHILFYAKNKLEKDDS